jgi:lipoprotein-anchoring transpeptidase ErfK/SrfK
VAKAVGPTVDVFASPDSPAPAVTFPNPWFLNDDPSTPVPQVFLVDEQRPDGWVQIRLPERPNGSTGWVRSTSVQLNADPYRIDVSLTGRSIEVHHGATVVYQGAVAIGTAATPTPTGLFYVRVLLQTVNPNSVYGPYAYGLSGHSDVLTTFDGGDGEIGIHGNNDASVLGQSVTHGCIRMDNAEITALAAILPLGTPVQISE